MGSKQFSRLRSFGVLTTQVVLGLWCLFTLVRLANVGEAVEFQRFGSLLVFFGVVFLFGAQAWVDAWVYAERQGQVTKYEFEPLLWAIGFVELAFIAIGTLIWGYGDLFVCWLQGHGWVVCYQ